ncbi:bifunctional phosphoribosylaminoimidazolecarboxamide formyltransferase/IMP cyclohydrolase [Acuticoccus sp. I52.16.1]|uniref:bifunctional phosphoribosylaminoimidazolecarboxamide formyltransferase/IMP cyclohydrolase n=1 Tax=Acuticoccus sp. I52.16.1 TaxID=2928472 RepID=UPI001FD5C2F2|nr:bifunctional phosphoribosylaminoimidazolecarboxamide formyltransferase/IMP cyclohydrolase [Acuticoccus sp. I52.16.1]UOM35531.1 bifunctional phosphoribosylaminoimidazolecarboxamide formyltransferase/IMP cyclohydrolase [Acuticoccus sp. I52.16.1]
MTATPVRRALLSVWDKTGLVPFAQRLVALGVELVSTGGTSRALKEAGLPVTDVSDITNFPEMLDGRVKTLHPGVHGGLLADLSKPEHAAALEEHGIGPIGLLVSNLYPFEMAIESGKPPAELVEQIDVGGPSMTRGAAKNFAHVALIVDPDDYDTVADALEAGGTTLALRRRLAAKAFARLAAYDATIAAWMAQASAADDVPVDHRVWAAFGGKRVAEMRYGENPHQSAGFYRAAGGGGIASARIVQGKALSYNNVADGDAALSAVADFGADVAAVVVKHANPCGIAVGADLAEAYERARLCDPVSAFGGVVALSRPLDKATAEMIAAVFTEVVIAPGASDEAMAVLATKPNVRLLLVDELPALSGSMVRSVGGGLLVQSADDGHVARDAMKVATRRAPTEAEWADLAFAWRAVKHVKSNAIVYAKGQATVGVGAGQMSRVDSARIAAWKAADTAREAGEEGSRTLGSAAASDAFFPFADGLETIAAAGATAVIQPGGSRRDDEVIAAADAAGIAMVMTGMRHFRH